PPPMEYKTQCFIICICNHSSNCAKFFEYFKKSKTHVSPAVSPAVPDPVAP
ncbi:hypothetical protein A2U01_0087465, partial [Trifolium medium]|nr:hypothetical protein [Trifolium medium]